MLVSKKIVAYCEDCHPAATMSDFAVTRRSHKRVRKPSDDFIVTMRTHKRLRKSSDVMVKKIMKTDGISDLQDGIRSKIVSEPSDDFVVTMRTHKRLRKSSDVMVEKIMKTDGISDLQDGIRSKIVSEPSDDFVVTMRTHKRLRKSSDVMVEKIMNIDLISNLPDGIRSKIVSLLPLDEAVRTSVLSKRWQSTWTDRDHLHLDSASINILPGNIELMKNKFVERVDSIMNQRCKGHILKSFAINFPLGKEFNSHINNWVKRAVNKGAENIELCLWGSESEICDFDCSVLTGTKRSKLKHLLLDSCSICAVTRSFFSLMSLGLRNVSISDAALKTLVSNCDFLESLSLDYCQNLKNLKVSSDSSNNLKHLNIKNCLSLNQVVLFSENLTRLEYTGPVISFSFDRVPSLIEVYMNFTHDRRQSGVKYVLTRLPIDLPQLEKLNLVSILSSDALNNLPPENGPVFTNIKHLNLSIYPLHDEDKLSWIAYILKSFLSLEMLQLNFSSPNFISDPRMTKTALPKCRHKDLKELEINGFYGNQHEVELLKYLHESLIDLKLLMVRIGFMRFKGFEDWVYEEATEFDISMARKSIDKLFHKRVPHNVRVEK